MCIYAIVTMVKDRVAVIFSYGTVLLTFPESVQDKPHILCCKPGDVGGFIIRVRFWGIVYYKYSSKGTLRISKNSIGNYLAPI